MTRSRTDDGVSSIAIRRVFFGSRHYMCACAFYNIAFGELDTTAFFICWLAEH